MEIVKFDLEVSICKDKFNVRKETNWGDELRSSGRSLKCFTPIAIFDQNSVEIIKFDLGALTQKNSL